MISWTSACMVIDQFQKGIILDINEKLEEDMGIT